jgi:hypothetical protein
VWIVDVAACRALRYAPAGADPEVLSAGTLTHTSGFTVDLGELW